ncbi:glutamine synthetase 2 cytoplasmic-like protein [Leptotrombidium deliense]|uniref:glutamine synthetase n=1 Tax=Leptotrombidium deliense TaxID=299467 RepID=A0A443SD26_9ACAR|nr:glutamine synthetase 2 cytoplasmic-like protein [Leptotrombidium deliense]
MANYSILQSFLSLNQPDDKIQVNYVWIDGTGEQLRCKTKTVPFVPVKPSELPIWRYCGSATGQATGNLAEFGLIPVALYNDPFRRGNNKLVLCESVDVEDKPTKTNKRSSCLSVINKVNEDFAPWFGVEQEYTLIDVDDCRPLGWPKKGFPGPQGPYYCGVGAEKTYGRHVMESHYRACLYAGIPIAGENAEVMPAEWEYQVGPCAGIAIGDDVWMSRFILHRVAEEFGAKVTFDPKVIQGDWNGAGAHMNFSTKQMRAKGGLKHIEAAVLKLRDTHNQHIPYYDANGGKDNERRLTGNHETSKINEFTSGVGDRGASVRIPLQVAKDGCGYLEDRRPASNCDPYVVAEAIVRTSVLLIMK